MSNFYFLNYLSPVTIAGSTDSNKDNNEVNEVERMKEQIDHIFQNKQQWKTQLMPSLKGYLRVEIIFLICEMSAGGMTECFQVTKLLTVENFLQF